MHTTTTSPAAMPAAPCSRVPQQQSGLAMHILGASPSCICSMMIQALLPSIYPMLKAEFSLSFTQVGLIP
jgi:FSR family fosmidomycin resistance protein-like MFS transporter